jgi:hypothetical protein
MNCPKCGSDNLTPVQILSTAPVPNVAYRTK